MTKYLTDLNALTASQIFSEASKDELKVLLALMSLGGEADIDTLASMAGVSRPRVSSAISLFEEAQVIKKSESKEIIKEFKEDPLAKGRYEERSEDVANSIRDEGLAELISELAVLMEKPALGTQETKCIVALYTQYGLTPEYVLTLASHLKLKGRLTAKRLADKAQDLIEKSGIDNLEALEIYISARESEDGKDMEFRRLFGIWDRNLTPTEKKHFKIWNEEFCYGVEIVGEAFDICVENTGKLSYSYISKLLKNWHDHGCQTVAQCRSFSEGNKPSAKKAKTKEKTDTSPKFSDFDADEALMLALKRSYGDMGEESESKE